MQKNNKNNKSKYSQETKDKARDLWLSGAKPTFIAETLGLNNIRIVYTWRDKYEWHLLKPPESALITATRHFNLLIDKEEKTKKDWFEIDKLTDLIVKLEKAESFRRGDYVGVGRSPGAKNNKKQRRRKKNDVSAITAEMFDDVFERILFPHQKIWIKAGENKLTKRVRFILKSRQIGATFTFALEAFRAAVIDGHNQIFISSTKAQAKVFKSVITIVAREHFEVDIVGDPVILSNGAELHFLSPNSFADSRAGDVYFDECFKTYKFKEMEEIAAPMATLTEFKKTYFSSPTAKSHPAYQIWDGSRYTKHHKDVKIDVSDHKSLIKGKKFDDGIWRSVCTIHDAIEMGWSRVNLDELKQETPDPVLFAITYECAFVDDSNSIFKLNEIMQCGVDTSTWEDFDKHDDKPLSNKPVTAGYDPAGIGDNASFQILSKPANIEEKFRLLDGFDFRGVRATEQCARIERFNKKYNIEYMEIDSTGPGIFVGDFVQEIYPRVNRITYNPIYKSRMVQKFQSLIQDQRFEYNENDSNLPLSFLTIYMKSTDGGDITYASRHSQEVAHGDRAWAIMHACMCEKFNPAKKRRFSITTSSQDNYMRH